MRLPVLVLLFCCFISTQAQQPKGLIKRLIHKTFSTEVDSSGNGNSFFVVPAFGYAQETGAEIGVAATYNFFLDKTSSSRKTSTLTLISTFTTKGQKKINTNAELWTKDNDYHILLELRARDWPFNFYGIGNKTRKADEDLLDHTLYRVKVEVEKKIANHIYLGLNSSYDHFKFADQEADGIFDTLPLYGKDGGQYVTFGFSALYDSRDLPTYSNTGIYLRIKGAYAPPFFTSKDYKGTMVEADLRGFKKLYRNVNLAAQILYRGTYGHNLPFYTLRDLGGDMTMRGYYLGRYRDKNYIATQAEIRYRFHPRLGINAFAGTGTTFSKTFSARLVPSYGIGGRYFYSLKHASSIRLDYAIGEQRHGEKRQSGIYLSIAEAF